MADDYDSYDFMGSGDSGAMDGQQVAAANPQSSGQMTAPTEPQAAENARTFGALMNAYHTVEDPKLSDMLGGYLKTAGDWAGKVGDWANKNKADPFLKMGLDGLGAHFKNEFERERAATVQQYAIDRADHDAQIAKDRIAAHSASVSGIPAQRAIIAGALRRLNGQPVFNNGRMIRG